MAGGIPGYELRESLLGQVGYYNGSFELAVDMSIERKLLEMLRFDEKEKWMEL